MLPNHLANKRETVVVKASVFLVESLDYIVSNIYISHFCPIY